MKQLLTPLSAASICFLSYAGILHGQVLAVFGFLYLLRTMQVIWRIWKPRGAQTDES